MSRTSQKRNVVFIVLIHNRTHYLTAERNYAQSIISSQALSGSASLTLIDSSPGDLSRLSLFLFYFFFFFLLGPSHSQILNGGHDRLQHLRSSGTTVPPILSPEPPSLSASRRTQTSSDCPDAILELSIFLPWLR